tara:strand:- start:397 stop:1284 length:888 start_codon:yes stop_codon:yes gene_type:complete
MKYIINPTFDKTGAIFLCSKEIKENCEIAIFGVPFDGTTSFRPGARFGPAAIREVSVGIESFCPQLKVDLEEINFSDFGSLEIPFGNPLPVINEVEKASKKFFSKGIKPLMIGGEHSITSGAVKAAVESYPNLILLQLDAHADLRNDWLGSKYNHACTMQRCLDYVQSSKVYQIGIRSGTRQEFQEMENKKRLINHLKGQPAYALDNILKENLGTPIYLTVDLDWFDPSVLPGTGTPEPGGYYWEDFAAIIDVLKKHNIIAADVVELAPQLDTSSISSIFAAKVVRSLIMLLSQN